MTDDDICGEQKNDGSECTYEPKHPDGKCGHHSEHTEDSGGDYGAGDANQKHGVWSDRSLYYQRLPDSEKELVDSMVRTFLEDAPFDETNTGKVEMLRQVAIDWHKRRQANDYISAQGLERTVTEGYHEDYGPIENRDEHHLNMTVDRLGRTSIRILKELGILDDPDSQQAQATTTLLEHLSDE